MKAPSASHISKLEAIYATIAAAKSDPNSDMTDIEGDAWYNWQFAKCALELGAKKYAILEEAIGAHELLGMWLEKRIAA